MGNKRRTRDTEQEAKAHTGGKKEVHAEEIGLVRDSESCEDEGQFS